MPETPEITHDSLIVVLDNLKIEFGIVFDQLDSNSPMPSIGQWNARQVLSHVIGALNHTPIHAGYFLADVSPVPVVFSDPYWIDAWHDAPVQAFKTAFDAAVEANKSLIHSLPDDVFWRTLNVTGFGEIPLANFLMVSYHGHVKGQHLHQLRAFTEVAQPV